MQRRHDLEPGRLELDGLESHEQRSAERKKTVCIG
jgi:hypothetical protein